MIMIPGSSTLIAYLPVGSIKSAPIALLKVFWVKHVSVRCRRQNEILRVRPIAKRALEKFAEPDYSYLGAAFHRKEDQNITEKKYI